MRTSLIAGIALTTLALGAGAALAVPAGGPAPSLGPTATVLHQAQFPGPYPFGPPGPGPFFPPGPGPFFPPGPGPFFGPGPGPFFPPGPHPFFHPGPPPPFFVPGPPPPPIFYPGPRPYYVPGPPLYVQPPPYPAVAAPPYVPRDDIVRRLTPPPPGGGVGERSIDLDIRFAFDSAELLPEAQLQLQALGAALTSEQLRSYRFLIAGHTDASGTDAYNRKLSDARAKSVADYLAREFGIEPWRLQSVGYGEQQLKNPAAPTAAENRRVEVRLLGAPGQADSGAQGFVRTR